MAKFSLYAPLLKILEGGFVNNPADPGGATCKGVTLNTYRQWYGADKTVEDLRGIRDNEWTTIMKAGYWDKCKADKICNQSVAEIIVDWDVNSGVKGIKRVQKLLNVSADGIIGPRTLLAINMANQKELHERILKARYAYYDALVAETPSKKVFINGWYNRLGHFKFSAQ